MVEHQRLDRKNPVFRKPGNISGTHLRRKVETLLEKDDLKFANEILAAFPELVDTNKKDHERPEIETRSWSEN